MSEISQQTISFWRDEDLHRLDFPIVFIRNEDKDQRGRWPGDPPSLDQILHELEISRMSYLQVRLNNQGEAQFLNILVGRIVVHGSIGKNKETENLRLFLNNHNGFEFASNQWRAGIISGGTRISHQGVCCISGDKFRRAYETQSFWSSGEFVRQIEQIPGATIAEVQPNDSAEAIEIQKPNLAEKKLLDTIEQYIDAEYEIEQQRARQEPPFLYFNLQPQARRVVYRQFFRLTLDEADLTRLRDIKATILRFETGDDEGIIAEVADINPNAEHLEIIVSVEKQLEAAKLPTSGKLYLEAIPTLKKVRSEVVQTLRDRKSQNPWFVPVAAETYSYQPLQPVKIELPPSKYSPNPSQQQAINRGAGTQDYMLVLGPPGTGKTTVILSWVEHLVLKHGKRVLVTSQNNKAVDNVLERLAEKQGVQCVRLGNESKVSSSVHSILIDNVARDIQAKLVSQLSERHEQLKLTFAYLEKLPAALQQYHLYHKQAAPEIQQKHDTETLIAQQEQELRTFAAKKHKLNFEIGELYAQYRKCESQSQKSYEKPFWIGIITFPQTLWNKLKLQWNRLRLQSLSERLIKCGDSLDDVNQGLTKTRSALDFSSTQQQHLLQLLKTIEIAATTVIPDVPQPFIADWLQYRIPPLINFNLQSALDKVAEQQQRYQKLQATIDEWHAVITSERQKSLYAVLLSMVDVVGATCIGINTDHRFKETHFDVVIVDESGQIQIHNLCVPLSRAAQIILVGDHKQLPPVVQDEIIQELEAREVDTALLKKSWFEVLWDKAPTDHKVILDTQFRCPAIISDYVSEAFYDSAYHAGKGMEKKAPLLGFCKSTMVFIDTSQFPETKRYERSHQETDGMNVVQDNPVETELVVQILRRALIEKPELGAGEIGIIVPYANHVKQIQSAIKKQQHSEFKALQIPVYELVASVDSFQGQERDLIILAFTRSNPSGRVGFLRDWRRLNVAMTRTKRQLIMVGDLSTLTHMDRRGDQAPDAEFKQAMRKLVTYIHQHCHYIDATTWLPA